jgi:hypothetical protein
MNEPNAISVILTELVSFYIITIERGIQREAVDLIQRIGLLIQTTVTWHHEALPLRECLLRSGDGRAGRNVVL